VNTEIAIEERLSEFIGMLHVPVNTICASPPSWREDLALPAVNEIDWLEFDALEKDFGDFFHNNPFTAWQLLSNSELATEMEKKASKFSFFPFLLDRVLTEAEIYFRYGADALMLENIAAPYFVPGTTAGDDCRRHEPACEATSRDLSGKTVRYPDPRLFRRSGHGRRLAAWLRVCPL